MKKSISLLLILISFVSFVSFAQKTNQKGYVYYGEFENIYQGLKGGREIRGNLIFDSNESYYYTGKDSLNNEIEIEYKKMYPASAANSELGGTIYAGDIENAGEPLNYRIHTSKDSISDYFDRYYPKHNHLHYLKEAKPKFNWALINETKKVGNFNCLKATCHFRGRDYIAWYTLEIPVSHGPWKFQGLPGLILEVYTPNQEIYFSAKKILFPFNFSKPIPKINKPSDVKWMTSVKELLERQDEALQEIYEHAVLILSKSNIGGKIIKEQSKSRFKEIEQ
jgi:GLPGLI family protein